MASEAGRRKVALVTGASRGIGLEVARQLGRRDMSVLLGVRNGAKSQAVVEALRSEGIAVDVLVLDVADERSVERAAGDVASRHGRLDVLVNNAAVNLEQGVRMPSELTLDAFTRTYATNVFGAFLVIKAFLPLLRKSSAARIVNVSSTTGSLADQADPHSRYRGVMTLAYNSSKTALNMITIQLAKELTGTPIKVNSACPGWVRTDMGTQAAPRSPEQGAKVIVDLATLPPDGPTGGFFDENGAVPW